MSEAWREVARLGNSGEAYPHILADSHGWCLRLGPHKRTDDKYYSSFQSVILGLVTPGRSGRDPDVDRPSGSRPPLSERGRRPGGGAGAEGRHSGAPAPRREA
jgi:hypothetical protein